MLEPLYGPNRNCPYENTGGGLYCPHCDNQAWVLLDGFDVDTIAPCPMCRRGQSVDTHHYGQAYWTRRDLATTTWNGGVNGCMNIHQLRRCRHVAKGHQYPCGKPTSDQWCHYHSGELNRQNTTPTATALPGAASSGRHNPEKVAAAKKREARLEMLEANGKGVIV